MPELTEKTRKIYEALDRIEKEINALRLEEADLLDKLQLALDLDEGREEEE